MRIWNADTIFSTNEISKKNLSRYYEEAEHLIREVQNFYNTVESTTTQTQGQLLALTKIGNFVKTSLSLNIEYDKKANT